MCKKEMVRVRFAPSPTGPLHIGGLRTALFNYLYAKKHQGAFVLRVEDTDQKRKVEGSEEYIENCLAWCGLSPDESPNKGGKYGPYRQSERGQIYKNFINQLIDSDRAYYAFDTPEELDALRSTAEINNDRFMYCALNRDHLNNSLSMTKKDVEKRLEEGAYVVRLKVEPHKEIVVEDKIRGTIQVNSNDIEDKILMKADGLPTYHFANVVDDHLMEITTVIRGEEWLPSLPLHQLIYDAFGWTAPEFMHLPLILNPSGKGKLSKRDGDKNGYPVFPLAWDGKEGYKEKGFLPQAHLNYIAQLGWSIEEGKEIFSIEELIKKFAVGNIQKGGARFDYEKAKWVNQQHLANMSVTEIIDRFPVHLQQLKRVYKDVELVLALIKDRLVLLNDLEKESEVFLSYPKSYSEKGRKRLKKFDIEEVAHDLIEIVGTNEPNNYKELMAEKANEKGLGMGAYMQVLRFAVVGDLTGPDLIPLVAVLGKNVTVGRLERLIEYIND